MAGRYGVDQLGRAISILVLILFILSLFTRDRLSSLLFMLAVLGIIYMYFRVFSRNRARRAAENSAYLKRTASSGAGSAPRASAGARGGTISSSAAPSAGRCCACPAARGRYASSAASAATPS